MSVTESAVNSYLGTLLWSETLSSCDYEGNPRQLVIPVDSQLVCAGDSFDDGAPLDEILDSSDLPRLAPHVIASAREDLEGFQSYVKETLGFDPFEVFDERQVAHDFCLSRNGHGAGFFDGDYTLRHDDLSEAGQVLADVAEDAGRDAINVNDALQDAAQTFGTHGLQVWVEDGAEEISVDQHN